MKKYGLLILVCVGSSSAAALEPLGPYPDRSAPADVPVAPRNTKLWVFGIAPPSADNVGVQVTYDVGTAVLDNFQPLGNTGFVVDPNEALSFAFIEGDTSSTPFGQTARKRSAVRSPLARTTTPGQPWMRHAWSRSTVAC